MIKPIVYIPGSKKDSNCRGYWINEAGKVEKDYINSLEYNQVINGLYYENNFFNYLDLLKRIKTNGKPQECIFYKIGNIGYIYYSRDKITILPHRIIKEVSRDNLKQSIRETLKQYSGLTIYQENKRYYIEIFTTI